MTLSLLPLIFSWTHTHNVVLFFSTNTLWRKRRTVPFFTKIQTLQRHFLLLHKYLPCKICTKKKCTTMLFSSTIHKYGVSKKTVIPEVFVLLGWHFISCYLYKNSITFTKTTKGECQRKRKKKTKKDENQNNTRTCNLPKLTLTLQQSNPHVRKLNTEHKSTVYENPAWLKNKTKKTGSPVNQLPQFLAVYFQFH